ncbi:hypothetical protein N0V95_005793 [Ascochyta clinopodiicola]|nr:hypothetical protein N0V95_005793 [Ascochyta clinopodiicola]
MAYSYLGPKISLDVVNYSAVQANDAEEIRKLVEISQASGIFFLDLKTGSTSGGAYDDMPSVIEAQRRFFSRDAEQKLEYADEHPSRGFDMFEALSVQRLKMSRQQHLSQTLRLPPDLQPVSERISSLFALNDTVLRQIAQKLSTGVSPSLEAYINPDPTNPGDSNMCLGIASARAGLEILGEHLDEDILTITYYDEPFLEVQDRKTGTWGLVEVNEHMPIVNVGDELQKASKGMFYAPPHRVVQSPKEINLVMYDLNEGVRVC